MKRREFLAAFIATVLLGVPAQASDQVTFHFYGAEDCPPCMAFKRDHLADVQALGETQGFIVKDNVIKRTRDVPKVGAYGDRDPILRLAAPQLELVYPPIFFVSSGGQIVSVHGHNWRAALQDAQRMAEQSG